MAHWMRARKSLLLTGSLKIFMLTVFTFCIFIFHKITVNYFRNNKLLKMAYSVGEKVFVKYSEGVWYGAKVLDVS